MKSRTAEQEDIINEKGNCVVIAIPGSGKTFTLSEKIKTILPELPSYKGVVAISYTNKASNELKQRTLSKGVEPKNSFFGTIDKFCVIEIIIPFGKHLWGLPTEEIKVLELTEIGEEDSELAEIIKKVENSSNISPDENQIFQSLYQKGVIVLEKIGILANVILANSKACQSYLVSRYTHIIIDEYQDSDFEQNKLFLEINRLGLCAVAVGDLNQAIFGFAGKEMLFLESLCNLESFKTFPLTFNFRCHPSIENYSKMFLKTCLSGFEPRLKETEKIKVFEKKVIGGEQEVIAWLDRAIPTCRERFGITENSKIGILVTSCKPKSSGKRISSGLNTPNRLIETTLLDKDINFWSDLFSKLLSFSLNLKSNPLEFLEEFIDIYDNKKSTMILRVKLEKVKNVFQTKTQITDEFIENVISDFEDIARLIYPRAYSKKSLELLNSVISIEERLANYLPPRADEVQILTLHKSKGLEFDVVFHCDLYSFILPRKTKINGQWVLDDKSLQDNFNLHYVGLTRAKECCVLLHSTQRTNARGETSNADPSEFLLFDGLKDYRILLP